MIYSDLLLVLLINNYLLLLFTLVFRSLHPSTIPSLYCCLSNSHIPDFPFLCWSVVNAIGMDVVSIVTSRPRIVDCSPALGVPDEIIVTLPLLIRAAMVAPQKNISIVVALPSVDIDSLVTSSIDKVCLSSPGISVPIELLSIRPIE